MVEKVAQLALDAGTDLAELLGDAARRSHLERKILPAYIQQCRWYRSKNRKLAEVVLEAWTPLPTDSAKPTSWFTVIKVSFDEGEPEHYALPLSALPQGDAVWDPDFRAALFRISMEGTHATLGNGILKGMPISVKEKTLSPGFASQLVGGEQSNTAFVFSTGHFLKLYRHLEEGLHPEPEILNFLKQVRYPHVPAFRASLEWQRTGQPSITTAMVQDRIETEGNAWEYLLDRLTNFLSDVPSLSSSKPVTELVELPVDLAEWTRLLGQRTAGLHLALASRHDAEAFAPEPFHSEDLTAVRTTTAHLLNGALGVSEGRSAEDRDVIQKSLAMLARMEGVFSGESLGNKIRTHSDLHLGQILRSKDDICFIDFEGEPARPLSEKRRKHSPLRDVAGMLRSFHYAVHVASLTHGKGHFDSALPSTFGELFLEGYLEVIGTSDLLPQNEITRDALLDFFVLEKTVYELHYELNNRPDWVEIPLRGLLNLIRGDETTA